MQPSGNRHDRAQTSPLSVLLIVSITITAATVIVVFGGSALEGIQQESQVGQAEQAMTQFDSRAAQVALGDSQSQNVQIGQQNGDYEVNEDAGAIRIYHEEWNETDPSKTEYIYGSNDTWVSLGAVVYQGQDTEIAYQGGGVWRKDQGGNGSTMVSPPEFHYQQATLTFPLVRVNGSGSASGRTNARVTRVETAKSIYPIPGEHYNDNPDNREYFNPVQDGNMTVEIRSEYCEAWRTYLVERTEGRVSDCSNNTVKAQLITLGTQGDFSVMRGTTLNIRGQEDDEPLNDFTLTFESDSNSGFNNFEWKAANDDGAGEQFEIYIEATEGSGDGVPVHMHVYYSDSNGDPYQSWTLNSSNSDAFKIEGEKDNATLEVNLLNGSRDMVYEDFGNHDLSEGGSGGGAGPTFESGGGTFNNSETINGTEYTSGDTLPLDTVMQYYFGQVGDVDLTIDTRQKGSAGLDPDGSGGTITYKGGGRVVTYLHITENRIRVELD